MKKSILVFLFIALVLALAGYVMHEAGRALSIEIGLHCLPSYDCNASYAGLTLDAYALIKLSNVAPIVGNMLYNFSAILLTYVVIASLCMVLASYGGSDNNSATLLDPNKGL